MPLYNTPDISYKVANKKLDPSDSSAAEELIHSVAQAAYRSHYGQSEYSITSEEDLEQAARDLLQEGYSLAVVTNSVSSSLGFFNNNADTFFDTLLSMLTLFPNAAMDAMAKRWVYSSSNFPKLSCSALEHIDVADGVCKSRRTRKKKDGAYTKGLKICLRYLQDEIRCIPLTISDALSMKETKPEILNRLFGPAQILFPVLDGGLQDKIFGKKISSQTWMIAIQLLFSTLGASTTTFAAIGNNNRIDDRIREDLDRSWPMIVSTGLLLHQLEILQNPELTSKLYEVHREPSKTSSQIRELNRQIDNLRTSNNSYKKKCESLERDKRLLQQRLEQAPTGTKDVDGIIERHQQTIRELNAEIERMRGIAEQLETANAELEHQMYLKESAEHQDKPWMDIDLPETNVLFVGGNPNCNKKWRNKYPKWTFVSTENPNAALPGKVEVIFLCVDHKVSHPLWYRINEIYQNRSKMCYVQATNLDRLNEEMHYEYWKLLSRK